MTEVTEEDWFEFWAEDQLPDLVINPDDIHDAYLGDEEIE